RKALSEGVIRAVRRVAGCPCGLCQTDRLRVVGEAYAAVGAVFSHYEDREASPSRIDAVGGRLPGTESLRPGCATAGGTPAAVDHRGGRGSVVDDLRGELVLGRIVDRASRENAR